MKRDHKKKVIVVVLKPGQKALVVCKHDKKKNPHRDGDTVS
ncbi:hypothetical protein ACFFK0_20090 [Paenibacillus chartarius]|uniref:Uncharacterized protein n=1 Tax=Paenibacillus chartarius TaxID=747481 RepID=A0ABV6DPY0_9BACL